jgi:uncharacterized protein YwgA
MNSLVVGGILRRIYSKFDMVLFSDRLKLQKIIYLLQQSGINLGYTFSFYHYGPYCTELAKEGFSIKDFDKTKEVGFEDKQIEDKFQQFMKKIDEHKNDVLWLEIASSIHLLKKIYPHKSEQEIISDIKNKRGELKDKEEDIKKVWNDITGWII